MTTEQWFPLPLYEYVCSIPERKELNDDLNLTEFEHRLG